jgi:hypothetical protein
MKKLDLSDNLRQRKRNAVNSHTSSQDVDNTMCGCEVDPLSTRGHCFQLLCMIGLPIIPVLALVLYSSLTLAGVIRDYSNLQVCIFHISHVLCIVARHHFYRILKENLIKPNCQRYVEHGDVKFTIHTAFYANSNTIKHINVGIMSERETVRPSVTALRKSCSSATIGKF